MILSHYVLALRPLDIWKFSLLRRGTTGADLFHTCVPAELWADAADQ